jgi:hypothetical protein
MKLATLLAALVVLAAAHSSAASPFPCRWNWDLLYGNRPGYVTAGNSADCAGRAGSLTLKVRLLQRDDATHTWRTVKHRARTFHQLNTNRFVEVATPCVAATFKAVMRWVLRAPGGAVVARKVVRTATVTVPSPNCVVHLQ